MFKITRLLILLVAACSFSFAGNVEKRSERKPLTTSVIIPCVERHFYMIFELLEHLANQTSVPDEVVISLSHIEQLKEEHFSRVEKHNWPFRLILLKHHQKKLAAENRNLAGAASSGDIIICQDADDIPHPQRIEIIKYHFETYTIDHLLHGWSEANEPFESYRIADIVILSPKNYGQISPMNPKRPFSITNGYACYTRKVRDRVQWPHVSMAEDVDFNVAVYGNFKNRLVIGAKLVMYRNELSSHHPEFTNRPLQLN
jgi:cellulose synthase/poly-beta-1,6-N-acetylglucosamine synthase-like glycosyltransferase